MEVCCGGVSLCYGNSGIAADSDMWPMSSISLDRR